jgi:hypothetical protein
MPYHTPALLLVGAAQNFLLGWPDKQIHVTNLEDPGSICEYNEVGPPVDGSTW